MIWGPVGPLLRKTADYEIRITRPLNSVVAEVLRLARCP